MKKFLSFFCVIATTAVLTLALSSAVLQPKAAAAPPPHPHVHAAIEALRGARDHMAHAEGEFHGHRDASIHHIDEAIKEAEICEQEP
jgi:hypothetical protein